jgi:hypothetical protein
MVLQLNTSRDLEADEDTIINQEVGETATDADSVRVTERGAAETIAGGIKEVDIEAAIWAHLIKSHR